MKNYLDRYFELCDKRDAVNATVEPLQRQLDIAVANAQEAKAKADALALQISQLRGGQEWLDLKKEIAALARALGTIPARPASE